MTNVPGFMSTAGNKLFKGLLGPLLILFTVLNFWPGTAVATVTVVDPQPDYTLGWCTAIGGTNEACYGTPEQACERQMQVFGIPTGGSGPSSAVPGAFWSDRLCKWQAPGGSSLPASVYFRCDSSVSPFLMMLPPGICTFKDEAYKGPCDCNGAEISPSTPYPINIITGSKRFEDTDFTSADGALVVDRTFVSIPFGQMDSIIDYRKSFGNWTFGLDVELHIGSAWASYNRVAVLNAEGTGENFARQTDGSMKPFNVNTVAETDSKLSFVGSWPGSLSTLTNASTQWQLIDRNNNIWLLQAMLNPGSGKYDIARPIQLKRSDGTVLTIAYGTDGGINTITDQAGKVISLTWNQKIVYFGTTSVSYAATISSITLPGGYKVKYTYDNPYGTSAGTNGLFRLKKVEYLDSASVVKDSKSYQYTNTTLPFFVTGILDSAGALRWQAVYDTKSRATSSQGPGGEFATTVSYSSEPTNQDNRYFGLTRTKTDPFGRQTTYNFSRMNYTWSTKLDSVSKAATTHNPLATTSNTYGTDNFIATTTDEEGRVTKYTRNTLGQPTQIIEAFGTATARTTNYTWSSTFNLPTQIAETGVTTNITYDTQGRISTFSQVDTTIQSVPYSTNGQTRTWTYTYGTTAGANGKLIGVDGPLAGTGDTKSFTYNVNGYLASVTNEVGKVTAVTSWDWRGAPLTVVDPNSVSTTFTYDARGRPLTTTFNPGASQAQFTYVYDVIGNITKITLPTGGYLQYTYDGASRLTKITNDKNETITLTPNLVGDPTLEVTKNASATITEQMSTVYDEVGSIIQVLGAASTTATIFSYDKVTNLKTLTNGRSKTTTNTFDALNRVTQVSNPESQTTKYAYSSLDVVTSHKDGRNLETTFVTDGFGDVIQEVSPDRGTRKYWYDLAGRMTKLIDGDSEETDFSYDSAGRRLTKTFPGSSAETITYTYDSVVSGNKGNGRLTSVTEQSGSTAFTYDALGRVTKDAKTIQGLTYNVIYAYNAGGDITQETLPSGRVVTFTRDADGLITGVTSKPSAAGTVSTVASSMTYQPFGPLKGLTYGNGLTLTRAYNTNSWLTRIQVKNGATALFDLGYQYYDDGRLGEIDDNIATGRTVYIALTDSGRLSYAGGPWGQESFSWDAAGNRIGDYLTVGGTTTTTNEITWGTSNRLALTNDQNAVTKRTLQWRLGGDLYSDSAAGGATYTYLYNARKRLVQINLNSIPAASYGYDFQEHRVWRTISGAWDIHYIFDQAGHLLAEHNGYTGALLREYIWVDEMPIAVIDSTSGTATTYYIHNGHLNEPQVMTNASKTKVWDAYITPFGRAQVFGTTTANIDLRLPGQWYQVEAAGGGLSQNGYRDYDPSLGRYIEADPLGLVAGPNPYTYVDGQVYDSTDPEGLKVKIETSDPVAYRKLAKAYAKLNRSPTARKLNKKLEDSPITYRIVPAYHGAGYCEYDPLAVGTCKTYFNYLFIDPCNLLYLPTEKGDLPTPLHIELGHELGHASTGLKDDGPKGMNNINATENPIRRDFGLPLRTSYEVKAVRWTDTPKK